MSGAKRGSSLLAIGVAVFLTACSGSGASTAAPTTAPAASSSTAASSIPGPSVAAAPASPSPLASLSPATGPAAAAPSPSAVGQAAGATTNLTFVEVSGSDIAVGLHVALDHGFFQQQGLNVSVEQVAARVMMQEMVNGDGQFGEMGSDPTVTTDLAGGNIEMIAAVSNSPVVSLFSQKDVTSMDQMVGKQIAISSVGGTTEIAAKAFLHRLGMDGQATIIATNGDPTSVLAALQANVAAGAMIGPPGTAIAAQQGFNELLNGVQLGIPQIEAGIGVPRDYPQTQPDVVRRFLTAYQEAWTYMRDPNNKSTVVQDMASMVPEDPSIAEIDYAAYYPLWQKQAIPTIDPAGVQTSIDFSDSPGASATTPEQYFDNSYMEVVGRQMGLSNASGS